MARKKKKVEEVKEETGEEISEEEHKDF